MTEPTERSPDVDQPEGGEPAPEGSGSTPHPQDPAEGGDTGGAGADTPST